MTETERTPDDANRDRFKEALTRKNSAAHSKGAATHGAGKSVHESAQVSRRQFRRKSG